MKKVISFLMLLLATSTFAESGYAEHALIVHRLSYWAPDFLTITNNWHNLFFSQSPSTLKTLSVITEINGQSTKDMEAEDFYAIIDNASSFTIKYISKVRGENKTYTQQLNKKRGKLLFYNPVYEYYHKSGSIQPNENQERIDKTSLFSNSNVDFFSFCTFDFIVSGDDYGTDRLILSKYAKYLEDKGLKYSTKNPDIYLYLTKDVNSSIESIYVPNIVSTTHSSSSTHGRVHFYYGDPIGWGGGSSGTKTIVDSDIYVQFSILDAKKMSGETPPVVWQLIHSNHYTKEVNLMNEILKVQEEIYCYPFTIKKMGRSILTLGAFFENYTSISGKVSDISEGRWAEQEGIKPGSLMKKVKGHGYGGHSYSYTPGKGIPFPFGALYHFEDIQFDNLKITGMQYYGKREKLNVPYFYVPESELMEDK